MSERDTFERILAALHETALDPVRRPGASALIDEALGTHGSSVALGDGESEEDYRIYFMWTCMRGQRRRDLERLWFETHYPVDQGIPRLVHGQGTDFQGWPVTALVLVVDPAGGADIDPGVVGAALDLTGMQSRVAVLLAQGMSVPEIAAATGRQESTIRSCVKHVFARHGLTRRAELIRLVRSLAGTPETRS